MREELYLEEQAEEARQREIVSPRKCNFFLIIYSTNVLFILATIASPV